MVRNAKAARQQPTDQRSAFDRFVEQIELRVSQAPFQLCGVVHRPWTRSRVSGAAVRLFMTVIQLSRVRGCHEV